MYLVFVACGEEVGDLGGDHSEAEVGGALVEVAVLSRDPLRHYVNVTVVHEGKDLWGRPLHHTHTTSLLNSGREMS